MVKLIELQKKQKIHDEQYHRDIYFLSHQERFKHMAFHFGKYSGKLAQSIKFMELEKPIPSEYEPQKTLIDSFIVVLNCAEIFSLNLESELNKKMGTNSNESDMNDLSEILKKRTDFFPKLHTSNKINLLQNLLVEYTLTAQTWHKACDSLDHMEGINRENITSSLLDLFILIIISGSYLGIDFGVSIPKRWQQIESKKVL